MDANRLSGGASDLWDSTPICPTTATSDLAAVADFAMDGSDEGRGE
ncbi:hypothetical protein N624_0230 [Levilactobacillus brevis]|nr:hypothetical protein N624_0230 [Levilactobacillus brevis]KIO98919.1 hypothetical protein QP38_1608 [Levilactobacillus brevis]KIP00797.1 hypothetical protein N627_1215 [Levilactobacillus brevis]